MNNKKIYCAIDTTNVDEALELAKKIKNHIGGLKLGLEFFSAHGPQGVMTMSKVGLPLFLDLKYLDIETTVLKAIESLKGLPIQYLSIHIMNGKKTLIKAKERVNKFSPSIKLLGITVLTSFNQDDLISLGINNSVEEQVKKLAALAQESALDGIVCSPMELKIVKEICNDMEIFTPGIRQKESDMDDQKRIMSAKEALNLGADFLVIGRPITVGDPLRNIEKILKSIN